MKIASCLKLSWQQELRLSGGPRRLHHKDKVIRGIGTCGVIDHEGEGQEDRSRSVDIT